MSSRVANKSGDTCREPNGSPIFCSTDSGAAKDRLPLRISIIESQGTARSHRASGSKALIAAALLIGLGGCVAGRQGFPKLAEQPTEVPTEVPAEEPTQEPALSVGDTWTRPADGMVMV